MSLLKARKILQNTKNKGAKTAREGWIYSFQTACGTQSVRSAKSIPTSAEVGKGAALDPQTFEKV